MILDNREKGYDELGQAKLVMLKLLRVFDEICRKNNLKYWLDGGTLIGAIRHNGFIPWDDDIDVAMLSDDYEKFIKNIRKSERIIKLRIVSKSIFILHYISTFPIKYIFMVTRFKRFYSNMMSTSHILRWQLHIVSEILSQISIIIIGDKKSISFKDMFFQWKYITFRKLKCFINFHSISQFRCV